MSPADRLVDSQLYQARPPRGLLLRGFYLPSGRERLRDRGRQSLRRRMAGLSITVLLTLLLQSLLYATDYSIEVRLDPARRILQGKEEIRWVNPSADAVEELQLHLYYNAWQNADSSFLNSARISKRDFKDWREDEWAYTEIQTINVRTAAGNAYDLSETLEFIQPDDGNVFDQTLLQLSLPEAVAPGAELWISIQFEARVPRTFARTGFRGDYFFIAQWFPKLAVLSAAGDWNSHQFIQTEFFSDFGDYDVQITVPEGWVVGATGRSLAVEADSDDTRTHRFQQDNVHDFAWTTSPDFRVFEDRFEHPGLPPVDLRLLMMPDHLEQQQRYLAATRAALRYYGEWFGPYPYDHLTIVDPAWMSGSGGMEYPTLFTGGTRWWNTPNSGSPESVTIHEAGHQFWYGVVANNEFEDAWLDEGLNSYSTLRVQLEAFGLSNLVKRYFGGMVALQFDDIFVSSRSVSGLGTPYSDLKLDTMSTPSWAYGPASRRYPSGDSTGLLGGGAYGINSYTKPALMMLTLERYLGWDVFQRALATYFERWRFRHPRPQDFFQTISESSGLDLDWFWEQTYRSSNIFDYAVEPVESRGETQTVIVRRWGEATFPVEIEIFFSEGQRVREKWDGLERWKRYDFVVEGNPITRVLVDPERKLALDVNTNNNSWVKNSPAGFAALKWSSKWMLWLQHTLQTFAFYG